MEPFDASEKYRKYLIKLTSDNSSGYCVWGADMENGEDDKFLIKDNKVLVFRSLEDLRLKISEYEAYFFDKLNFASWIREEKFETEYSEIDIDRLLKFDRKVFSSKENAFDLVNALNAAQDFFIQINSEKMEEIFKSPDLKNIKDILYNLYFWKNDSDIESQIADINIDSILIKSILYEIHHNFATTP